MIELPKDWTINQKITYLKEQQKSEYLDLDYCFRILKTLKMIYKKYPYANFRYKLEEHKNCINKLKL